MFSLWRRIKALEDKTWIDNDSWEVLDRRCNKLDNEIKRIDSVDWLDEKNKALKAYERSKALFSALRRHEWIHGTDKFTSLYITCCGVKFSLFISEHLITEITITNYCEDKKAHVSYDIHQLDEADFNDLIKYIDSREMKGPSNELERFRKVIRGEEKVND